MLRVLGCCSRAERWRRRNAAAAAGGRWLRGQMEVPDHYFLCGVVTLGDESPALEDAAIEMP